MNARQIKKLSKRLVQIAPVLFKDAWQDFDEPMEQSYKEGHNMSGCYYVGGGLDYWGEGMDAYTVWEYWESNFYWIGPFDAYPEGHEHAGFPDIGGFKATTQNLLKLAAQCNSRVCLPGVRI